MRLSKKFAAIAITATVALTATAALAYWSTGGAGSGSASSAAGFPASTVHVNQNAVLPAEAMYPGGPVQNLSGDFTNDNPGGVYVTSLTAEIKLANGDPWSVTVGASTCSAADFAIEGLAVTGNEVDETSTGGAWSGTIKMLDRPSVNQDACKLAAPPIQYVAS